MPNKLVTINRAQKDSLRKDLDEGILSVRVTCKEEVVWVRLTVNDMSDGAMLEREAEKLGLGLMRDGSINMFCGARSAKHQVQKWWIRRQVSVSNETDHLEPTDSTDEPTPGHESDEVCWWMFDGGFGGLAFLLDGWMVAAWYPASGGCMLHAWYLI